jgi:hypothetical protein
MKKIFTLVAVALIVITNVNAQTKFGIRAGVNHSSWKGDAINSFEDLLSMTDGYVTTSGKTGFHAGGYAEIPLSQTISLQPGVYYSQKGYQMKGTIAADKMDFLNATATAKLQSHYIDIPVYLKANLGGGFHIYAGPQVSYLAKNDLKVDAGALGFSVFNRNFDVTDQFNTVDVGVSGGIGYDFANGLTINAGYDHGLSRVDKNDNFKSYNRNLKVGIGWKF